MEYVSPIDERRLEPTPPAPRPPRLDGRRVALLDIGKARGDEFLDRMATLLEERGAVTSRFAKPLFSRPAAPELIERIALDHELVVEALAD